MTHGRVYSESFDDGPGGWLGWISNAERAKKLEIKDGAAISRSPWWIDYNHAPPGGGYMHLLFCLYTRRRPGFPEQDRLAGLNRFVESGFPTDFTNARVTTRLKGGGELRGAYLQLLVQANGGHLCVGQLTMGQGFRITSEWSEQTITLLPDAKTWKCMGSRHDRTSSYGWGNIDEVLGDVNQNIIFVLHPLNVVPAEPLDGNPHFLRAGKDYDFDRTRLPEGYLMLDEIRIEFSGS